MTELERGKKELKGKNKKLARLALLGVIDTQGHGVIFEENNKYFWAYYGTKQELKEMREAHTDYLHDFFIDDMKYLAEQI